MKPTFSKPRFSAKSRWWGFVLLLGLLLLANSLFPTTGHVKEAKEESTAIPANQATKLHDAVGQPVTITGKISQIHRSKSGHLFVQFYSSDLTLVCFPEDAPRFSFLTKDRDFQDQHVRVTGRLELYREKPQIKLREANQLLRLASDGKSIETLDESTNTTDESTDVAKSDDLERPTPTSPQAEKKTSRGIAEKEKRERAQIEVRASKERRPSETEETDEPKKFALQKVNETTWLSPAGLRYSGRDPEGLTRVEHVLRHAEDQPSRAGSHGVFDGGADRAFAVIDEAWLRVKKLDIQPEKEGNRSSYLVPMGRRIGFLGGELGARKRNPPLQRVFIVVKSGTTDVVTAYPR